MVGNERASTFGGKYLLTRKAQDSREMVDNGWGLEYYYIMGDINIYR
jgi:hypothetical protein